MTNRRLFAILTKSGIREAHYETVPHKIQAAASDCSGNRPVRGDLYGDRARFSVLADGADNFPAGGADRASRAGDDVCHDQRRDRSVPRRGAGAVRYCHGVRLYARTSPRACDPPRLSDRRGTGPLQRLIDQPFSSSARPCYYRFHGPLPRSGLRSDRRYGAGGYSRRLPEFVQRRLFPRGRVPARHPLLYASDDRVVCSGAYPAVGYPDRGMPLRGGRRRKRGAALRAEY